MSWALIRHRSPINPDGHTAWWFCPEIGPKVSAVPRVTAPEHEYLSLLDGTPVGPGTDHPLGKPGLGYAFEVVPDICEATDVSFTTFAAPDGTQFLVSLSASSVGQMLTPVMRAELYEILGLKEIR